MKLIAILLIALILRSISLNQSFWLDEATSITVARDFSFSEIITKFSVGDFHPPLYYLMLKVWVRIFGVSEISARSLSILFALGTVVAVYKIGEVLFSKKVGYMAAILLATAPLYIYYSQEARMYVPVTFFVVLCVLGFLQKRWWLFAASLLAAIATDYMAIFILPVFWIAAMIDRKKFQWGQFVMSHIPLFAAVAVWIPFLSSQLQVGFAAKDSAWGKILGGASIKDAALVFIKFLIGRISFANKLIYAAAVGGISILAGLAIFLSISKLKKASVIWLWLIGPIILALIVSLKVPVLSYFRVLYCLPALYLLIAFGSSLKKWGIALFTIILVLNTAFSSVYLFHNRFHREGWRGLTTFITQNSPKPTRTIFVTNSQMEAYRYYASNHDIGWGVDAVSSNYETLWLMRYVHDIFDPQDSVRKKVEELGYKWVSEYNFNGIVVYKYENMH